MQPVTGAATEVDGQPHSGIGSDAAFFMNDLIDTSGWHLDGARKRILADILRYQVLL